MILIPSVNLKIESKTENSLILKGPKLNPLQWFVYILTFLIFTPIGLFLLIGAIIFFLKSFDLSGIIYLLGALIAGVISLIIGLILPFHFEEFKIDKKLVTYTNQFYYFKLSKSYNNFDCFTSFVIAPPLRYRSNITKSGNSYTIKLILKNTDKLNHTLFKYDISKYEKYNDLAKDMEKLGIKHTTDYVNPENL